MPSGRGSRSPFTVDMPRPLPATRQGEHWWMEEGGRRLRLSNLDKTFWPEEGYTKGDLLAYYYNVAPAMLPFVAGRPLTLKRMPHGATGDFFYEKRAPSHTPDWMGRCEVESEDETRPIDYLVVDDVSGMLFVANLGCIEFHPLHGRCETIEHPDYLFFDLDPFPPITFDDVLAVALHVRAALDALGLPSYPKTSGATGMQIYVGIEPQYTYEQTREFVARVGRAILQADPDRVTMQWDVSKRSGKVFIDHNMNRSGANISAVFSVRPEPGASVSMPVTWEEVEAGDLRPGDFTIANAHARIAEAAELFRPVIEAPVDIAPALEAVGVSPEASPARPPSATARVDASGAQPDPPSADAEAASDPDEEAVAADEESRSLEEYRRKRDFEGTPEPPPRPAAEPGSRFVIQKHDATRLHYDLRLERGGVLVSWAVPKGLPLVPGERRLAVHTEDHPLDYAGFEGWIPKGHYGAGEVRIFDDGTYEALEWKDDKVTFRLHGSRHRGEYHLVKTRTDWLVFLSRGSAGEQPPPPPPLLPMLAEPGAKPFDDPDWRFEPKLDGIRTLAYVGTDATRLVSRTGRDQTPQYPELANLAHWVNALSAVLDGEIVAVDDAGRPSFERLQQRMNLASPKDVERAKTLVPVQLFLFDVLWLDGRDLTREPLEERRRRLEDIATQAGPVTLTYYVDGEGRPLYHAAESMGFEGVIAKRLGSPYVPGKRSKDWRKMKALNRQECVILGWTRGTGSRSATFGALLVGAYRRDGGELTWIGQVGTGFTDPMLADLLARLESLRADRPPIDDPALRAVKGATWVRPELVCEVEYLQITSAGKLRAPSYKGLRPDKVPADCILEPPAT